MDKDVTFWYFLKKLKEVYKPFLKVIVVILSFMLVQEALNLISPYIYGKIIDGILQGKALEEVTKLCFLSLSIVVFNNVILNYFREKI